jgi:hypothetical protein
MTLPIPPSDSFYKFSAIGGLILLVMSLYVPWKMDSELNLALFDLEVELSRIDIETSFADKQFKRISDDLDTLEKERANKKKKGASEPYFAGLDERIQDQRSTDKRISLLHAESKVVFQKQKWLAAQLRQIFAIATGLSVLGLNMAIFGFWNWYFRFQVYQDRIIKGQSEQFAKSIQKNEREEIPG